MATLLKKGDAARVLTPEPNFLDGILKIVNSVDKTIVSGTKLLEGYHSIAGKLKSKGPEMKNITPPSQGTPGLQTPKALPPQPVEKAIKPEQTAATTPPQGTHYDPAHVVDKHTKAENLFKELHEKVKPFIPFLKTMTADVLLQKALIPKNKAAIIKEIEARL